MKKVNRWTAATAAALLEEQRLSGLTMEGFARKHGWHGSRLRWWKKHLESAALVGRMQLLPVQVVEMPRVEEAYPELEVVLRTGTVVRVRGRWDATTVRAMVTGVEGC